VLAHELLRREQLSYLSNAQVVGTNVHWVLRLARATGEKKPPVVAVFFGWCFFSKIQPSAARLLPMEIGR
jgi:hypothetical protein